MKREITMEDIPKFNILVDKEIIGLDVKVDGHHAHIFEKFEMVEGEKAKQRERIVMFFKDPHPEFGKSFITKYYGIDRPGWLHWGGGEDMRIELIK